MAPEKAPRWIITGILLIIILSGVINMLGMTGLTPAKCVSFSNGYGEERTVSFNPLVLVSMSVSLIYSVTVAILALVRKWGAVIVVGTLCLIACTLIDIWGIAGLLSTGSFDDLNAGMQNRIVWDIVGDLLYVVGCLILAFSCNISQLEKISVIAIVILFSLMCLLPLPANGWLIVNILKVCATLGILFIGYNNKQTHTLNKV